MCNLNIFIKNKEIEETTSFLTSISSVSYIYNPDGEGFYAEKLDNTIKSIDKIDLFKYKEQLDKSNYILLHERISTGGNGLENTHPFMSNEFVLIHNGIINSFKDNYTDNKSDTNYFFNKFVDKFNNDIDNLNREKTIKKIIKEMLNYNNENWSICIYDKIEDCAYYFKNNNTTIYGYKNHDYVYLTTNQHNQYFLNLLGREWKELKIVDNAIYKIKSHPTQIIMKIIGMIKTPIIKKKDYNDIYSRDYYNGSQYRKEETINDFNLKNEWEDLIDKDGDEWESDLEREVDMVDFTTKKLGIKYINKIGKCNFCGCDTHRFSSVFGDYICINCQDDCYDELIRYGGYGYSA
jgi:predicted glutamine amidotransferase